MLPISKRCGRKAPEASIVAIIAMPENAPDTPEYSCLLSFGAIESTKFVATNPAPAHMIPDVIASRYRTG